MFTDYVTVDHSDEKPGQTGQKSWMWETWACDTSIDPSDGALQGSVTKVGLKFSVLTKVTKNVAEWDQNLKFEKPGHVTHQYIRLPVLYNDQLRKFV